MTDIQKCPMCGALAMRVVENTRQVVADDGVQLQFQDELMECSDCGERHYTHEQAMASSRARAGALRQHAGLLTPEDIRAFRERYALSQAQLESILQTGAKTVVRWERGTVCQSRAADQLLRLLMLHPANLTSLAAKSGVVAVPAQADELLFQTTFVPAYFQVGSSWGAETSIEVMPGMTSFFDQTIVTRSVVVPGVAPRAEATPVSPLATAA